MAKRLTAARMERIAAAINEDGKAIAAAVMLRAAESPDIAMAIIGVAVGIILNSINEEQRTQTLADFFASFERPN